MIRRKSFILIVAAVLVVAAIAGVTVARAFGGGDLPALTPAQILAKVAQNVPSIKAASGDFSWANGLMGSNSGPLGSVLGAGLPFLSPEGTGKVWFQGGNLRLDVGAAPSSLQVVKNGTTLWVYSATSNSVTEYTLPAHAAGGSTSTTGSTSSSQAVTDPGKAIADALQKLAPEATVALADQESVAGRQSYVLSLTPTASNTVFGSLKVAIDGETFLPLRVEVFAKGDQKAVLSLGFTGISYGAVDASNFNFTPPAGAQVQKQDLTSKLPALGGTGSTTPTTSTGGAKTEPAPLTLAEAQAKAGYHVLAPGQADPALPFVGARVIDLPVMSSTPGGTSGGTGGTSGGTGGSSSGSSAIPGLPGGLGNLGSLFQGFASELKGPVVLQQYGKGFGTVILAELATTGASSSTPPLGGQGGALSMLPMLSSTTVSGHPALQIATPLGSLLLWQQDNLLVVTAGSVSQADLAKFAGGLK